jgi:hypothetical protein
MVTKPFKHIRLVIFVQKLQKWTSTAKELFTWELHKQENFILYLCDFWQDFKIPIWLLILFLGNSCLGNIVCTHTHTHIQTYIYIYIYTHTHKYIYIHTHTHTHTHTYIYIYIYIYINKLEKVCTVWPIQGVYSATNLCTHPRTVPIMINYSTVQEYWEIISSIIFPFLALRI